MLNNSPPQGINTAPGPLNPPPAQPAPPANPGDPILRRGSSGPAVADWQAFLGVEADGDFGPITERAVIDWQRFVNIDADGIIGPQSWAARRYIESLPTTPPAPVPPQEPAPDPIIKRGDQGWAVVDWQVWLNENANGGLVVDGDFGPATEQAVKNLQAFFGAEVDGIIGPQTWGLRRMVDAHKAQTPPVVVVPDVPPVPPVPDVPAPPVPDVPPVDVPPIDVPPITENRFTEEDILAIIKVIKDNAGVWPSKKRKINAIRSALRGLSK